MTGCPVPDCDTCASEPLEGESRDAWIERLRARYRPLLALAPPAQTLRTWSRRYACCVDCGTTEQPHQSGGRCHRCYTRMRWVS